MEGSPWSSGSGYLLVGCILDWKLIVCKLLIVTRIVRCGCIKDTQGDVCHSKYSYTFDIRTTFKVTSFH